MKFLFPPKLAIVLLSFLLVLPLAIKAEGVSPYLPLKLDPLVELDIERLVSLSKLPALKKPYHIVTVNNYLQKIKLKQPKLYKRLNQYISRYKKQQGLTQYGVELSATFGEDFPLANQRGFDSTSHITGHLASFHQVNKYLIVNGGGTFSEQDFVAHNSFVSFGTDYFQFDLGYREQWLSPLQESAALMSTNAKPAPSVTLSNVRGITDFNIFYQLSVGVLSEMEGIHFNNQLTAGQPGLLTMHASIEPMTGWTIAANRTFMFGGGERSISLGDVWNAFIDPISNDNCGGQSSLQDCDQEVGNQIAAINTKFDLSLFSVPFSFYYEYAGEDAKNYKYALGNLSESFGVFFPYLGDALAFYVEYTSFHDRWYVHHLYDQGYRNDGSVMGHWWGDKKQLKDKAAADVFTARINWDISAEEHLQLRYRSVNNDASTIADYQKGQELDLLYKHAYDKGFIGVTFNAGKDTQGQSFYRLAFSYNW